MQTLINAYNARRQRTEENAEGDSSFVAPPPYTPLLEDSEDKGSGLPPYTEEDPYHTSTANGDASQSREGETSSEPQASSNQIAVEGEGASEEVPEEQTESSQPEREVTAIIESSDSDHETQQSLDNVPLIHAED